MKLRQRQAVLLKLANALKKRGSWCGETHLQKASYFLEELAEIPLELDFILYKHGPFSFELRDELTAMRADGLMEIHIQPPPYGPSLVTTAGAEKLMAHWPQTLEYHKERIEFITSHLGPLGVTELERLATALYVTKEGNSIDADARSVRIHQLKAHVSLAEAKNAVERVDKMFEDYHRAMA